MIQGEKGHPQPKIEIEIRFVLREGFQKKTYKLGLSVSVSGSFVGQVGL